MDMYTEKDHMDFEFDGHEEFWKCYFKGSHEHEVGFLRWNRSFKRFHFEFSRDYGVVVLTPDQMTDIVNFMKLKANKIAVKKEE